MTTKSNIHGHTTFCDGKNTIDEMIEKAIELGFRSIGLSSHSISNIEMDPSPMSPEGTQQYFRELAEAKVRYADRIKVFTGIELDSNYRHLYKECDYHIGSIHYLVHDGVVVPIDYTYELQKKGIEENFENKYEFLRAYYQSYLDFATEVKFDIIGHVDLYTKFYEKNPPLFNNDETKYRRIVLEYIDAIAETGKIFEVNTGAIGRGYRTTPYPSRFILERLHETNTPVIITSDCHNRDFMDVYFDEAEEMLKDIGFRTQLELTENGFVEVPL